MLNSAMAVTNVYYVNYALQICGITEKSFSSKIIRTTSIFKFQVCQQYNLNIISKSQTKCYRRETPYLEDISINSVFKLFNNRKCTIFCSEISIAV